MASAASPCSGGPEHDESTLCRLFLLSELNTHYLTLLFDVFDIEYM